MGKEYIPLFLDFNVTTADLMDDECGRLIRAIVDYANGIDPVGLKSTGEKVAFQFLKGLVDRNAAISEARARAGASKGNKPEQNGTNENKPEQTGTNSVTNTKTNTKNKNKDQLFERFWDAYPRKVAKADARKKFEKINPDDELLAVMLKAIDQQKASEQWTKDGGQFIPHPSTWLNQRRWEDETQPAHVKVLPAQAFPQRDYSDVDQQLMEELAKEMAEAKARDAG